MSITGFTSAQSMCGDAGSIGFSEGSTVAQNTTYVVLAYRIPCNGTLVGWEFCHQIVNASSATFYPSVWRLTGGNYMLIHSTAVSFVPYAPSVLTFKCQSYNLRTASEEFDVLANDTVGLYSGGDNAAQILTVAGFSDSAITYGLTGNHSNFSITASEVVSEQLNVAIVAQISKLHTYIFSCY